jgi:hypothetical protein
MKTLKIMYRDGTEITFRQDQGMAPKPSESKAKGDRPGEGPPKPNRADDKPDSGKCSGSRDDSDWHLFPALRAPDELKRLISHGFPSVDAVIDHFQSEGGNEAPTGARRLYAIKHPQLDPFAARRIFDQLPDGTDLTILGDPDA